MRSFGIVLAEVLGTGRGLAAAGGVPPRGRVGRYQSEVDPGRATAGAKF